MKAKYLILSMLFIVTIALSGCKGEETTLESYMEHNPTAKSQVEQSVTGMSTDDMETSIDFDKNTVVITERLTTEYSNDIIEKMETNLEMIPEDSFVTAIDQLEDASGISGIKIRFVLENGDGTQILDRVYDGSR